MLGPNALSPGLYNGILQFKRSMISRVISLHRPNLSQQRLNWDLITKNPLWIQLGSAGLLLQHLDDNILFPTELYIANIEWSPCMCQYSVLFKEDMLHVLMAFNREKIVRQHLLVKNQFTVRHNGSFLLIGYTFICNIQCYCNVCWLETSDLGTCVFQSSKVTLRSTVDQSLSSGLSRTHPCSSRHGRIYVENIRSSCLRKKKKSYYALDFAHDRRHTFSTTWIGVSSWKNLAKIKGSNTCHFQPRPLQRSGSLLLPKAIHLSFPFKIPLHFTR